jgi:hypothetical protein
MVSHNQKLTEAEMLTQLQKMGNKLRTIRLKYRVGSGRAYNYTEFADLYNETEPTNLQTTKAAIGQYERGETNCPGDKWEKFLSLNDID